jgi:hypothetical protein
MKKLRAGCDFDEGGDFWPSTVNRNTLTIRLSNIIIIV